MKLIDANLERTVTLYGNRLKWKTFKKTLICLTLHCLIEVCNHFQITHTKQKTHEPDRSHNEKHFKAKQKNKKTNNNKIKTNKQKNKPEQSYDYT